MSKISLIQSSQSYQGALAVLKPLQPELQQKISKLSEIIVKVNFVSVDDELATTPFEAVRGFVDFVKLFYQGKIIIAEEAAIGDTEEGFAQYGFADLAKKEKQVEIFDSAQNESEKVVLPYPGGQVKLSLAKIYTQSPFIISICRAKTHDTVVVTLSIKNLLVGAIQQKILSRRGSIHQGNGIHWIMTEIAKHTYPDMALIDSVVGMEGNGPVSGTAKKAGWLVASLDALVADSLAANLMGFKTEDIGYFNLLKQADFGQLYPQDKIEILGVNPEKLVTPFKPHATFESQRHWQ